MARYSSNRSEGKYEILNLDSLIKGLGTVFNSITILTATAGIIGYFQGFFIYRYSYKAK